MLKRTVGRGMGLGVCLVAMGVLFSAGAIAQDEDKGGLQYLEYPYHNVIENTEAECAVCHFKTVESWKATTHKRTFDELHKRERAQEIVGNMGGRSIRRSKICTQCHYTMFAKEEGKRPKAIMGVSCQRCHGPAGGWFLPHSDTETEPDRFARLAPLEKAGMRPTYKLYELAQSCYQCHTVPVEDLVNTGGHNAGSDFELVAWSQGEVRHNFLPLPDEPKNKERDADYLQRLFAIGKILDLEWSLRGLAGATGDGDYKTAMTERVTKALEGAKAVGGTTATAADAVPGLDGGKDALIAAADAVSAIAQAASDGNFAGFDFGKAKSMLPKSSDYKGEVFGG